MLMPRTGRPPLPDDQRRDAQIIVRVTADEKAAIEAAANRAEKATAEWVRAAALTAAKSKPRAAARRSR